LKLSCYYQVDPAYFGVFGFGADDAGSIACGAPSGAFGATGASALHPVTIIPSTTKQNTLLIDVNNLAISCSV
jgi:hypothetical protein